MGTGLGENVHGAQARLMETFLGNLSHFIKSKTVQVTDVKMHP